MNALKNLDLFRKPSKDYDQQTSIGGVITMLALLTMTVLFVTETQAFLNHTVKKDTLIDQSVEASIVQINIDVFLPDVPCVPLSLDHQDDVNKHILDYQDTLKKIRISKTGQVIEEDFQRTISELIKAIDEGEGCQISGFINVAKVPGNFHVSLHVGHELLHSLPRDYLAKLKFNHILNHLSIGSDDTSKLIEEDFGVDEIFEVNNFEVLDVSTVSKHEYFMKIIPVQFINQCSESRINTYTFSLNRNSESYYSAFGAIYFRYSFEDLTMRYTKVDKKLGTFVVSVCAILGGVFTVLGIVNKVLS